MKLDLVGARIREKGRILIFEKEENGRRRQLISDGFAVYAVDDKAEMDEIFDLLGIGEERVNLSVQRISDFTAVMTQESTEADRSAALLEFALYHIKSRNKLLLFASEYGLMLIDGTLLYPFTDDEGVEFFARPLGRKQSGKIATALTVKANGVFEGTIMAVNPKFLLDEPARSALMALHRETTDLLAENAATAVNTEKSDGQ